MIFQLFGAGRMSSNRILWIRVSDFYCIFSIPESGGFGYRIFIAFSRLPNLVDSGIGLLLHFPFGYQIFIAFYLRIRVSHFYCVSRYVTGSCEKTILTLYTSQKDKKRIEGARIARIFHRFRDRFWMHFTFTRFLQYLFGIGFFDDFHNVFGHP